MDSQKLNINLYYFSGTGNAFSVAKWIENIATSQDHEVQLLNISQINRKAPPKPPKNATIGFISPTHGFNFPPIMFHFILRFPRSNRNSVFIVNTRGGMKLSKYFLPGLSGMAQYFSALILWIKGYKIIGMHPIDLPSNWISIHPGLKNKIVESIFNRRKKETEMFAQNIISGKPDRKALKDIIQDLLITPIGILYYFFGRYFFSKSFIASGKCDNCNLCIDNCPVKAIKLVDGRPYWTYKCESCMQCMNQCPKQAIETAHGFIIGLVALVNGIVLFQLYNLIEFPPWYYHSFAGHFVAMIVDTIIFLGFLFASYRILHYLKRISLVDELLRITSFTNYRFWRNYKLKRFKFWRKYDF